MHIRQSKKGSPKKMASEQKKNFVKIGFTDQELKRIKAAAKREGQSLASYLRAAGLMRAAKGDA